MGLRAATTETAGETFRFSFQSAEQIDDQLGRTLFSQGRKSEGLHTVPFIPSSLLVEGITTKSAIMVQLSELFPTDGDREVRLEDDLRMQFNYAASARRLLEKLSPNSWPDFFKEFCIPLFKASRDTISRMKESLQNREPIVGEAGRELEYGYLRQALRRGIMDADFRSHAQARLSQEGRREYAIDSIVAALERIYPNDRGLAEVQRNVLERSQMYPESIMFYAFVLSSIERKDIFSSYAVMQTCRNLIPVGWDFSSS